MLQVNKSLLITIILLIVPFSFIAQDNFSSHPRQETIDFKNYEITIDEQDASLLFNIKIKYGKKEYVHVLVLDESNRIVRQGFELHNGYQSVISLDLSSFPEGNYKIQLDAKNLGVYNSEVIEVVTLSNSIVDRVKN